MDYSESTLGYFYITPKCVKTAVENFWTKLS